MRLRYEDDGGKIAEYVLLPTQEKFYMDKHKFPLYSGGFGSGKTVILCHKIISHLMWPNNYGLLGRLTYQALKDTTQQTFFEVCPTSIIKSYSRSEQRLYLKNGSQLIFRHLDTVAEAEIKSLNLGFFAIDQVEDIPENTFLGLRGRLRRKMEPLDGEKYIHQGMMSCNPALFWGYKFYKQSDDPDYSLYEASTLENTHLPEDYVRDLLRYPEAWKRQYVYGIWDETLLAESAFFPVEYIVEQEKMKSEPIRTFEKIKIYKEVDSTYTYQIGVDPSEGIEDSAGIVVVCLQTGETVATWQGKMPADKLAGKINQIGRIYRYARVVLEVNSIGMATLSKLRDLNYPDIYKREVFDTVVKNKIKKFGWKTTHSNKVLLLDNLLGKMRENTIILNDPIILAEMKTFVWTDEAMKQGLGAKSGFHDDMVMASALAYWGLKGEVKPDLIPNEIPRGSVIGTMLDLQKGKEPFIGHYK